MFPDPRKIKMAVIGLGYVGLPLTVGFSAKIQVIGYDINQARIDELASGIDRTLEVEEAELAHNSNLTFTSDPEDLRDCNVYVVTTPTPVDGHKTPDLGPILSASKAIGATLQQGDIVIYESTVYPGATEEQCAPVLEEASGLKVNTGFYLGYSPERINPGDKEHRFTTITKVTSGSTPEAARFVDDLYSLVVEAGTHLAPTIKVAEAAKVIENVQRDVNIALINELSMLFGELNIDTSAVLAAAGTKWNFLKFTPGLVGGHCIGVDPYYLTYKANEIGFHPELILAGRRINDAMGRYAAGELTKRMTRDGILVNGARILILGLTFKENTPDLRNTRVVDIIDALKEYYAVVDIADPWCSEAEALRTYNLSLTTEMRDGEYDAVVLAVPHREFLKKGTEWMRSLMKDHGVLFDLKSALPAGSADITL